MKDYWRREWVWWVDGDGDDDEMERAREGIVYTDWWSWNLLEERWVIYWVLQRSPERLQLLDDDDDDHDVEDQDEVENEKGETNG